MLNEQSFINLQRQIDLLARQLEEMRAREQPAYPVRYETVAGQSIANGSYTLVDFGSMAFDPYGLVTTGAAWKYTAPANGFYAVAANILYANTVTWADAEGAGLRLYKNDASDLVMGFTYGIGSASSFARGQNGMALVKLAEGDYVDVRAFQNTGAALNLNTSSRFNWVCIWRIQ